MKKITINHMLIYYLLALIASSIIVGSIATEIIILPEYKMRDLLTICMAMFAIVLVFIKICLYVYHP